MSEFDFNALEAEIRAQTLAEAEQAEGRLAIWGILGLVASGGTVINAIDSYIDPSKLNISSLVLTAAGTVITALRFRNALRNYSEIPVI